MVFSHAIVASQRLSGAVFYGIFRALRTSSRPAHADMRHVSGMLQIGGVCGVSSELPSTFGCERVEAVGGEWY